MRILTALIILAGCKGDTLDTQDDLGTDTDVDTGTDVDTESDTAADELPEDWVTADGPGDWSWLGVNTAEASIRSTVSWPDSGTGAFLLSTGDGSGDSGGDWPNWQGGGGKAFLGTTQFNGLSVSDITALSYTTWVADDSELLPYINLFIDVDGNGSFETATDQIWAFDPAFIASPAVGGEWQEWDAFTEAHWRCVFGRSPLDEGTCAGTATLSWSELVDGSPSAVIVPASCGEAPFPDGGDCTAPDLDAPGLLFVGGQKTGGPWAEWTAYVDGITVAPGGPEGPWNFEP